MGNSDGSDRGKSRKLLGKKNIKTENNGEVNVEK